MTREDMVNSGPKGHPRDGWMRLVDYWYSGKSETLAEIGREARASQNHFHTTGSTSYANKRADFVDAHEREPTNLEFLKETHATEDGGFIDDTVTDEFLNEASVKVEERMRTSSPSKTQADIENEVFDDLMHGEEIPKRPVGFGFGVDRSAIFGVNGVLRKRGYSFPTNNNSNVEIKRLKEDVAETKAMLGNMARQFSIFVKAARKGQVSDEFANVAESMLRMVPQYVQGSARLCT